MLDLRTFRFAKAFRVETPREFAFSGRYAWATTFATGAGLLRIPM